LNLSYYALPENIDDAQRDFSDHPKYLKTFEELFGAYPFVKEKYSVAEFWWQSGAMENQTITGIGSNFISGRKFFSGMLIHELAHHWWGDAVGLKTWKDIWLNEGFATYSEALYWEKQSDIRALQSTLRSKFGLFPNGTLYNPGNALFSSLIYDKGAWVLHMLRKEIGDEIFFNILRDYFKEYKYGNASTNDFKNLCERISKKNLNKFFDQWVYKGEGIIELNCVWSAKKEGEEFISTIKIKQLQKGYDIYKFPLDIKLISEKESESETSTVLVDGKEVILKIKSKYKPAELMLDPDGWLLAKINLSPEENKK
jgi:aminopeptidase N